MRISTNKYLLLISLHVALAFLVFFIKPLSFVYALLIVFFGVVFIVKNNDKNFEALYFSAYFVGIEIFLRITGGIPLYEISKYMVIVFMSLGMFYRGINKQAGYYFIFILLLLPALFITAQQLDQETNMRKAISFNLSGPICLAISAMYCIQRQISIRSIVNILFVMGLPIVSTAIYLFLYAPNVQELVTGASSNLETSGGFGPNQVATILGLGMFVFLVQILFTSKNKILLIVNTLLLVLISYRGIITFSRGGVITAIIMMLLLIAIVYINSNKTAKAKLSLMIVLGVFISFGIWTYSSFQTSGMIENRYKNQNAAGVERESLLTGRETLIESELQMFYDNPIFGVGVGRNKEIRLDETGIKAPTHSEISRALAEHGMFGLVGLLILIFVPLYLYPINKENIFLLSFFVFWALTINHAAMRLAAPAFIYALSLLKVTFDEKPTVHRE